MILQLFGYLIVYVFNSYFLSIQNNCTDFLGIFFTNFNFVLWIYRHTTSTFWHLWIFELKVIHIFFYFYTLFRNQLFLFSVKFFIINCHLFPFCEFFGTYGLLLLCWYLVGLSYVSLGVYVFFLACVRLTLFYLYICIYPIGFSSSPSPLFPVVH